MFLVWGSKAIRKWLNDDPLVNACPECGQTLFLCIWKKWFTLYWLPLFPMETLSTAYTCRGCDSSYKIEARDWLLKARQTQEETLAIANQATSETLVSLMRYISKHTGKTSAGKSAMVQLAITSSNDNSKTLAVANSDLTRSEVFRLLRATSESLSQDGKIRLLAGVVNYASSDGKVQPDEEKIIKDYMLVAGLSDDEYPDVLKAARNMY